MRTAWLLVLIACKNEPTKSPPPVTTASGSAPVVITTPPCMRTRTGGSDLFDGTHVRHCSKERTSETRHCVAIAADGSVTSIPPDTWPPAAAPGTEILVPTGFTAKATPGSVEVCKPGGACTKIPLAAGPKELDEIQTIAVIEDHVWIDRGTFADGPSRVEVYTLDPPKLVREVAVPSQRCSDIAGLAGALVVVQGIVDCQVNHSGKRALAKPNGEIVHVATGNTSINDPIRRLDATRWAIMADGVEIWDVVAAKRLAHAPDFDLWFAIADGKVLVSVDNDGTITRYDDQLKPLGTTKLPSCEPADVAAAPPAAPTCHRPGVVEDIVDGRSVKFCIKERYPSTTRHCTAIDREGVATYLPPETWPLEKQPDLEVIAPPGWTAKTIDDDRQNITAVEVCKDATCTKLPLAKQKPDDLNIAVATVAVAPDGKHVAIDRGPDTMGASRLEIHTLAPPKFVREVKIPGDQCTNIAGYLGDTMLLQGIYDCVNLGGTRALASSDGKILAKLGDFSVPDPYKPVGGSRWVFLTRGGAEVWDAATAKRVARTADLVTHFGVTDDHVIVALEVDGDEGTIKRFDADLKLLGTTQLAVCPRGN